MKLADVLWEAANVYLSHRPLASGIAGDKCEFSCHAFNRALHGDLFDLNAPSQFLNELGVKFNYHDCLAWDGLQCGAIQGVRYMWLLLAMHVAEDEGIEIEVPA